MKAVSTTKAETSLRAGGDSLFEQAARVFDGWTDPETGARVLRVRPLGLDITPGCLTTVYHQIKCFQEGGKKVLLHVRQPPKTRYSAFLDLATGRMVRNAS